MIRFKTKRLILDVVTIALPSRVRKNNIVQRVRQMIGVEIAKHQTNAIIDNPLMNTEITKKKVARYNEARTTRLTSCIMSLDSVSPYDQVERLGTDLERL